MVGEHGVKAAAPLLHSMLGANVIDELQREYDELKRRANELRSFL
jgi:hypothetical protein